MDGIMKQELDLDATKFAESLLSYIYDRSVEIPTVF